MERCCYLEVRYEICFVIQPPPPFSTDIAPASLPMNVCERKFPIILTLGTLDIAPPVLAAIRPRHVAQIWL